jgi:translation initiation factor 1
MNDDRRLVYSTEQGMLDKPMQKKQKRATKKQRATPASTIRNPNKAGVRIHRESKGRGGKCVSIITGLPLDAEGLKQLLKKLKSQLGTGGAVKGDCIEIQGDKREALLPLLEREGHIAKLSGG